MIFSKVLSQCVMSKMIHSVIFKPGLINGSCKFVSAF